MPWKQSKARIASGFDRLLLYEFDMLEQHRAFTEKHFTSTAAKFEKRLRKELSDIDDEEDKAAYADYMNEEYIAIAETFPRLQWYAQFLVVYSTFEHELNHLCDIVKNRSGFELSVKDLAGQGIRRAVNYLRKVASVDKPFQSQAWQRALLLGDILKLRGSLNYEGQVYFLVISMALSNVDKALFGGDQEISQ